jgi:predicted dehydrogenase
MTRQTNLRKPAATRRMLAVGGRMGAGIIAEGRKYGMDGAIVDIDPGVLKSPCDHFRVPGYASIEEALAAHDDFAGAYIATPNHTHAELALKLAPLNIPVFMEKPLGINEAECRRVVDAYARSRGWLQIDFEYRFSPIYAHAAEIVHSGELGELRSLHVEYTVGPYRPSQGWRLDPAKAGGIFAEKLCHFVDLIRFWTRSEFASIAVTAAPRAMDYYHPDTTDFVVAQYWMENGVYAHLMHTHGSTALPQDDKNQEPDWTEYGHRLAVYLNTALGCVHLDIWKRTITVIRRDPEADQAPRIIRRVDYQHMPFMASHHDMSGMLKDFARRVHEGAGPRLPLADSHRTMLAVFECDRRYQRACRQANRHRG